MARSTYLGTAADMLLVKRGSTLGVSTKAGVLRFWDSETDGTRHTDLLLDGAPVTEVPIPAGTVLAPAVQLPDGVNGGAWVEYVLDGATTADTREFVLPRFTPADVPTPTPEAIGAETPAGAQAKADTAEANAVATAAAALDALKGAAPAAYDTLVEIASKLDADDDVTATILADLADKVDGADLDTLVAAEVDTPASATAAALSATIDSQVTDPNGAAAAAFGRADWTFVPANRLIAAVGSPALVSTSATVRWLMDAASVEQVAMTLGRGELPKQWAEFDVYAVWVNESATSGNVVLRADVVAATGEGSVIPAPVNVGAPTFTAPTVARQVAIDKINASPLTAPTDLQAVSVLISRRASDAADTLANDIGLLGVVLGKP